MTDITTERKQLLKSIERFLVRFRVLSICVMVWSGWIMTKAFNWMIQLQAEEITMQHAAIIGAVYAPIAVVFKFAFDFALDGKIDSNHD